MHEVEDRKALDVEAKEEGSFHEAGTAFETLCEKLSRLSEDPKCSRIVVFLLVNKLDQAGKKVVVDGMAKAEARPIEIHVFDEETRAFVKRVFDSAPVLSILVLWTRYGAGKLGILRLKPLPEDRSTKVEYEEWEGKAIAAYLRLYNL